MSEQTPEGNRPTPDTRKHFLMPKIRPHSHAAPTSFEKDSAKTAEALSLYKARFALVAESLMSQNRLPRTQFMENRLALIRRVPLLVTRDPAQMSHYFDPNEEVIKMPHMDTELHRDHEMAHVLLPEINWKPLNEGVTQKVARMVNQEMMHPKRRRREEKKEDFYVPNEEIVDQITRLTGLTLDGILRIASDPAVTNVAQALNKHTRFIIQGKDVGIIDYGEQLEKEAIATLVAKPLLVGRRRKDMDEFIAKHVVQGFKKIPSVFPVPV